jgi:hypothetical protein
MYKVEPHDPLNVKDWRSPKVSAVNTDIRLKNESGNRIDLVWIDFNGGHVVY